MCWSSLKRSHFHSLYMWERGVYHARASFRYKEEFERNVSQNIDEASGPWQKKVLRENHGNP